MPVGYKALSLILTLTLSAESWLRVKDKVKVRD